MEEIARLGFWVAVGIVIAASIIAEAMKEREKHRQKHETFREIMRLEADGKLTPETLKYIREREAADQQLARELRAEDKVGAGILAFIVGVLMFVAGLAVVAFVMRVMGGPSPVSLAVAGAAALAAWVGGVRLAVMTYRGARGQKGAEKRDAEKGPRSGA